ncbi:MAG TPA: heme o synthase [bacterium]|nr:heme o synthase [bacterium]
MIEPTSASIRLFRAFAVTTAVAAYLLVLLGGLVRITGAGLACPDWPLCHGRLVPPLEGLVLIEYGHRLLAASVSALVLVTAVLAWRARRKVPGAGRLALAVLLLVAVQIVLGGLTVKWRLTPGLVATHLGVAMLFLAGLLAQAVNALRPAGHHEINAGAPAPEGFRRLALAATAATFVMMLIGGYVGSSGAALACPSLPFCRGGLVLLPPDAPSQIHMLHRLWALVVAALVIWTASAAARLRIRRLAVAAHLALLLVALQIAAGALNVVTRLAPAVQGVHLALAAALFAALVVLTALTRPAPERALAAAGIAPAAVGAARRGRPMPTIAGGSVDEPAADALSWPEEEPRTALARAAATARDYLALMKPRIIMLLLITTITTMIVASPHHLPLAALLLTVLGGTLAAGSANAFNMYVDRDIDAIMRRTCLRPVPAGRVRPAQALIFGVVTGCLSMAVMAFGVNLLAAALSTAGILFYVGVYTLWLKRATPQNIVIGGAAGAVPPLVGWAAATGRIEAPAVALFAIVFLWTPPHFWALALGKADDYRAAGVPMLPVVRGEAETRRQIFIYSLVLAAATLALYVPLHALGPVYAVAAVALDAVFVGLAWAVLVIRRPGLEMALFGYSILYLGLLFTAMVVDRLV